MSLTNIRNKFNQLVEWDDREVLLSDFILPICTCSLREFEKIMNSYQIEFIGVGELNLKVLDREENKLVWEKVSEIYGELKEAKALVMKDKMSQETYFIPTKEKWMKGMLERYDAIKDYFEGEGYGEL